MKSISLPFRIVVVLVILILTMIVVMLFYLDIMNPIHESSEEEAKIRSECLEWMKYGYNESEYTANCNTKYATLCKIYGNDATKAREYGCKMKIDK